MHAYPGQLASHTFTSFYLLESLFPLKYPGQYCSISISGIFQVMFFDV
jgi:hypothetical protein